MLALVVNFHPELRRRARLHPRHAPPYAACSFLPSRFLPRSPFPTHSRLSHFCHSSSPFFFYEYELPIFQVLCFDIHTKCRGGVLPPIGRKRRIKDTEAPETEV